MTKKADDSTGAGVGTDAEAGGSETDSKNLRSVDGKTPYV